MCQLLAPIRYKMKDRKKLIEVIEKYVIEPYKKGTLGEVRPSIRLKTTGMASKDLGRTKLGGCPELSKEISWPKSKFNGSYLSFLGQINLEEVREFDEEGLLPNKGMLYFFFNLDSGDDGKIIFLDEVIELERAVVPEEFKEVKKSFVQRLFGGKSSKRILKESLVEMYKEYNMPSWDSLRLEKIQKSTGTDVKPIDAFEDGIFEDCYEEGETETTSNHHLIGNYRGIQNEYHELDCVDFDFKDLENMELFEIEKALKWKLLFQFDSDNNLEVSVGDWGRIYFFIHEDDLKKQIFDNLKIVVDSY